MAEFRDTKTGGMEVLHCGRWTAVPDEVAAEIRRLRDSLKRIQDMCFHSRLGDSVNTVEKVQEVAGVALGAEPADIVKRLQAVDDTKHPGDRVAILCDEAAEEIVYLREIVSDALCADDYIDARYPRWSARAREAIHRDGD